MLRIDDTMKLDFSDAPEFGRTDGIRVALELLSRRDSPPAIVETGTTRGDLGGGRKGDGWATLAWGWFCAKYGGEVHTIDLLPEAIEQARQITRDYQHVIRYHIGAASEVISGINGPIDLLYLDSADDPAVAMAELSSAMDKLSPDAIVMVDDTPVSSGRASGKGEKVVPFLLDQGWEMIHGQKRSATPQVILVAPTTTKSEADEPAGRAREAESAPLGILHLSSEYPPQSVFGLGRYVKELAETQAEAGHRVVVMTNSHGGKEADVNRNGVRVMRTHFPPPPKAPSSSSMLLHFNLQLMELCMRESGRGGEQAFDVVCAHDWLTVPAAFHISRVLERPVVTTIHDVIFNKAGGRDFLPEDKFIAGIENWACHFSNKVIVLSETVKRELVRSYHAPADRVEVVPGGVGVSFLDSSETDRLCDWRSSRVGEEDDFVLYVGRLDPEKGLPALLQASLIMREQRPQGWRVGLAGTGLREKDIDGFIEKNALKDHVFRLGYLPLDELRLAYAAADVVVVPSVYEPFGLVSLEAQKMGTPVICSRTGGLAETMARTRGGLFFKPGDPVDLSRKLLSLLSDVDLRRQLGTRGQRNTTGQYSWPSLGKEISRVYRTCVGDGPPKEVVPPPWQHPSSKETGVPTAEAASGRASTGGRVADVTVFWNAEELGGLPDALNALSRSHTLSVLGGKIHVLRVATSDAKSPWTPPLEHKAIVYHSLEQVSDLQAVQLASSFVVCEARLAEPLCQTGVLHPDQLPTLWLEGEPASPLGGWCIKDAKELFALSDKLLCDDSVRRVLAPSLANPLRQASWKSGDHDRQLVIHILPQLVTGGAETTLLEIIKGSREQFRHAVLSLGPVEGPLPAEMEALGVTIEKMQGALPSDILGYLEGQAPDLLHLHSLSYVPAWIPVHRHLADVRIIETEHVVNIGAGHFGPVDRVICVSEAARNAHRPYEPAWRDTGPNFAVIHNGIDIDAFEGLPSKEEARKTLGLPNDKPIVGRVSALARNKLPTEALQAIPKIVERKPDVLFAIVGDGPDRPAIEEWVKKKGLQASVRFLGERRDIPLVLRAFDLFGYYTLKDAHPVVLLEAAAAGLPIVATDVEGVSEAWGGPPGTLVPVGNTDAFADAVAKWLERIEKGEDIPIREFSEEFTTAAMARQYRETYEQAISEERKPSGTISGQGLSGIGEGEPVTVLIPFYKPEIAWLRDALDSVKAQTYPHWRLVLVDDGNEEGCRKDVEGMVLSDPVLSERTEIIRLSENGGAAVARNAGLKACRTELVALLDADDRMTPDRLEAQADRFLRQPELAVLGSCARHVDAEGKPTGGEYVYPEEHHEITTLLRRSSPFANPSVMYRKSAVESVGGYRSEYRYAQDYDLWVRMTKAGFLFANLPQRLIEYRIHPDQVSWKHKREQDRLALSCLNAARGSHAANPMSVTQEGTGSALSEAARAIADDPKRIRKVLVGMDEGIGNMVMLTPMLRALHHLLPMADIDVAGNAPALEVLRDWPVVSSLFGKDDRLDDYYDLFIATGWNYSLGPRLRNTRFGMRPVIQGRITTYRHEAEQHMDVVRALGFEGPTALPHCSHEPFELPEGDPKIGLADAASPNAGLDRKRWPHYRELAGRLLKDQVSLHVFGGNSDAEIYERDPWPEGIVDHQGRLSLLETAGAMRELDLLVANDCGLAHMAAALNVPTLCLWGPTCESKNRPLGRYVRTISIDLDCAPCYMTERWDACPDQRCMTDLGVDQVHDQIRMCLAELGSESDPEHGNSSD